MERASAVCMLGRRLVLLLLIFLVDNPTPADFAFVDGNRGLFLLRKWDATRSTRSLRPGSQVLILGRTPQYKYFSKLRRLSMTSEKSEFEDFSDPLESTLPPRPLGPDPFVVSRTEINALKDKIKRMVEGSLKRGEPLFLFDPYL
jgi:hypothetical protein